MSRLPRRYLALFAAAAILAVTATLWGRPAPAQPVAARYPTAEIRGVWLTNVDSSVLFSSGATRDALERLDRLNFNTVYPTIWQSGYTLYPSDVAERTTGVRVDPETGEDGRDMLQEIIDEGHARNLTVMPWFEFGFMAPAESELVRAHPDWVTNHYDGTRVQLKGDGTFRAVWLNPFKAEVQQFLLDMVLEVVRNYDIDGIQFDDHFSLPVEFGYDRETIQQFEDWLGDREVSEQRRTYLWTRWRSDRLTDFMQRLHDEVKAIKPDCTISLSPNPFLFALNVHLQDWFRWQENGLVDEVILQVYRDNLDNFIRELDRPELQLARARVPVAVGILSGLKNRPTPIDVVEAQVQAVRDRGFSGVSFFFYESLWRWGRVSGLERQQALYQLFARPLERPQILTSS